jgi:hypothetical protein
MSDKQNSVACKSIAAPSVHAQPEPESGEHARVWAVLEQARQNVKPIVNKEKEAEVLPDEVLNLRLKTDK